jgi:hypothetical protein
MGRPNGELLRAEEDTATCTEVAELSRLRGVGGIMLIRRPLDISQS